VNARTGGLTLLAMLAFAANSLLCRAALDGGHADATSFTSLRLIGGAIVLVPLTRLRGGARPGAGSWLSAFALFAYALSFSVAYLSIPAGTGALLLFGAVQLTMVGSGLWAGERPSAREWVGLLLSFAGLVALTRPGLEQPDPMGALVMLVAGVAWGVYSLRGRGGGDPLAENASNFARSVPMALFVSGGALAMVSPRLTMEGASLALASGALASGLGYTVWYSALRGLSATKAAVVQLSVPPLTAAGGVVLLGELVTPRLILAGLMILGGIALAITARSRQAGP